MALLGNGSVYTKMPIRHLGGSTTSVQQGVRANWGTSGSRRNAITISMRTEALDLLAMPTGAYPHTAFFIPVTRGQIASRQNMTGAGAATFAIAAGRQLDADLTGAGGYSTVGIVGAAEVAASLTGSASITPAGSVLAIIAAALSGSAALTGSVGSAAALAAVLTGAGATSATLSGALGILAALEGSGSLAGDGTLLSFIEAVLSGSGAVSATSKGGWLMNADLSGAGAFTPEAHGHGIFDSTSIVGTGSVTGTPYADGSISATVRSYGDLTPEGLSAAVWARIIEAGFTAEEVLRILAAVAAGDASGLEGATPSFKGLDGTTTRVAGDYGAGERVMTTVDGG